MKIFITGTSRGLGCMLAKKMLESGHEVTGISRGKSQIQHPRYRHSICDLSDLQSLQNMLKEQTQNFDVLINNAAIAKLSPFLLSMEDDFLKVLQTNLIAPYLLSREIAKGMVSQSFGRIINISTIGTTLNFKGESQYLSSKAALEKLTSIWAKELYPYGITVNNISCSLVDTDLIKGLNTTQLQNVKNLLPVPSLITADEIFHVIDFFLHQHATVITGQTIQFGGL